MEKHDKAEIALGTLSVYIIITTAFSLLYDLCRYLIAGFNIKSGILTFFYLNTIHIIVSIAILAVIIFYMKRYNLKISFDLLNNSVVRLTSGLLVAADSLVRLSSVLPLTYVSIKSVIQTAKIVTDKSDNIIQRALVSNIAIVIFLICQALLGIWIVKFYKPRENKSE